MADIENNEFFDDNVYTLTDEDGNEEDFVLLAEGEVGEGAYVALIPADQADNDEAEYVILKREKDENGDEILVSIDDDDEYDEVSDAFNDMLFDEIDYDGDDK